MRSPPFAYRSKRDDMHGCGRQQKARRSVRLIKTSQSQGKQTNFSQSLREVPMRCKQLTSFFLATTVGVLIAGSASAQVTAFEGARVIVGDGRVLDNTTIVV